MSFPSSGVLNAVLNPESATAGRLRRSASYDSGFEDGASSSVSLDSALHRHEEKYNRTYHAFCSGKYNIPNDGLQTELMEIIHHVFRLMLRDKNYVAPVSPRAVLDVATGSGLWCLDVADEDPACTVKGIDLTPVEDEWVAPNCFFYVADADGNWVYNEKFGLVHTRHLHGCTSIDWHQLFDQVYLNLQDGGWFEMQEIIFRRRSDDNSIPLNSRFEFFEAEWHRGIRAMGYSHSEPEDIVEQLKEKGFVEVECFESKLPIGGWPKKERFKAAGLLMKEYLVAGLPGMSLKLFRETLGYREEDLERLLMECGQELEQKGVHAYLPFFVIRAQKPKL